METEQPMASPVSIINMLRSVQQHHVTLSAMADQKASFLIGASVVTLTIVLGHWKSGTAVLPMITLGIGSLLSSLFASLALIPRSKRPKDEVFSFNPLFFGHFTTMGEDEYVKVMNRVVETDRSVFEAAFRDIYQMGQVLSKKKFYYLAIGYRCFVITLLATLVTAVVEVFR